MTSRMAMVVPGALALALLASTALGGEFNPLGDGSDYNNPDLLRDKTTGCENCKAKPPYEWGDPPFDLDWSLGLRGTLTHDEDETSYSVVLRPEVSLTHEHLRGGYTVEASGEVSYELDGNVRVNQLQVSGDASYQLDAVTGIEASGSLSASQDDPGDDPSLPTNVKSAPLVLSGAAEAAVTRELGLFDASLRGSVGRTVYGETVYNDDSTSDNTFQNTTTGGVGARLGYRLTPSLTAFVDGQAVYEMYDAASPSLLVLLDNVTYAGRAGLALKHGEVLELEGSLGVGYRDFGDGSIADVTAVLYDARATFRPDETLTLTGAFTTSIGSPGTTSGTPARIEYALTGDAAYRVNPWLRLRASAGWSEAQYVGLPNVEYRWSAGAGADYLLNEHTDLTADYAFSRTELTPAPATDQHRATLGITFHR